MLSSGDDHAHAADGVAAVKQYRARETRLGGEIGHDHRLRVAKRVARLRVTGATDRGLADEFGAQPDRCAEEELLSIGKQRQNLAVLDVEQLREHEHRVL